MCVLRSVPWITPWLNSIISWTQTPITFWSYAWIEKSFFKTNKVSGRFRQRVASGMEAAFHAEWRGRRTQCFRDEYKWVVPEMDSTVEAEGRSRRSQGSCDEHEWVVSQTETEVGAKECSGQTQCFRGEYQWVVSEMDSTVKTKNRGIWTQGFRDEHEWVAVSMDFQYLVRKWDRRPTKERKRQVAARAWRGSLRGPTK